MCPAYLKLYDDGELDMRIDELYSIIQSCVLCPRECRKNRLKGETGYCRSGETLVVSAIHPHFGEEGPLVGPGRLAGAGGSGTIFLAGCNLGCVYCQNYDISHLGEGRQISPPELAEGMIKLQNLGCHNINFVTPTHFVPQLVKSLRVAIENGLNIPIVYNCGGYESANTIRLLDGIVDIYMPDIKYSDSSKSEKYSDAPDYFQRCCEAVIGMHRQVGDLELDGRGIARRGMLIRHLVLPGDAAGSEDVFKFIAEKLSRDTYVNIMFQYRPMFRAGEFKELNRSPSLGEFQKAIQMARDFGLHRGFTE
ncbi:MAG: radical SAM protein [Pirellulales bacterium]|nr:radical SAM protein [Pirellulales bacterium]